MGSVSRRTRISWLVVVCLAGRMLAPEGVVLCTTPDGHARVEVTLNGTCADSQASPLDEPCSLLGAPVSQHDPHTDCAGCIDVPLSSGHSAVSTGAYTGFAGHSVGQLVACAYLTAPDSACLNAPFGVPAGWHSSTANGLRTTHLLI